MADKKTEAAQESVKAEGKEAVKENAWKVSVAGNPEYCGIGAGGIQFANGSAVVRSERMAAWFREHKGYTVTQQ